jgi:hypothetical protein
VKQQVPKADTNDRKPYQTDSDLLKWFDKITAGWKEKRQPDESQTSQQEAPHRQLRPIDMGQHSNKFTGSMANHTQQYSQIGQRRIPMPKSFLHGSSGD